MARLISHHPAGIFNKGDEGSRIKSGEKQKNNLYQSKASFHVIFLTFEAESDSGTRRPAWPPLSASHWCHPTTLLHIPVDTWLAARSFLPRLVSDASSQFIFSCLWRFFLFFSFFFINFSDTYKFHTKNETPRSLSLSLLLKWFWETLLFKWESRYWRLNLVCRLKQAYKTLCARVCVRVSVCVLFMLGRVPLVEAAAPNCHQWVIRLHLGQHSFNCRPPPSLLVTMLLLCSFGGMLTHVNACVCVSTTGGHTGDGRRRGQRHGEVPLRPQTRQRRSVCR